MTAQLGADPRGNMKHSYSGDFMAESLDVGVYCFVKDGIKIIKQIKKDGEWQSIMCPEKFRPECRKCRYRSSKGFVFR